MLRTLFKSDVERLVVIENAVHVAPWTDDTFKMCFKAGYLGWVAEVDKKIAGFVIISLNHDECHVLNLGVDKPYQSQGWGRKLMDHALAYARGQGVAIAYLEVRRSNSRAISLYRKMRFHLIGERKNYYPTVAGHEDALVFGRSLIQEGIE